MLGVLELQLGALAFQEVQANADLVLLELHSQRLLYPRFLLPQALSFSKQGFYDRQTYLKPSFKSSWKPLFSELILVLSPCSSLSRMWCLT